jgi:hypothetical protein
MADEINELTELAYEGSGQALTLDPVVGTPSQPYGELSCPARSCWVPRRSV